MNAKSQKLLKEKELERIQALFEALDSDQDGKISAENIDLT